MKPIKSLLVFFPAHNEVDNLRPLVEETDATLSRFTDYYEIMVVND